MFMFSDDDPFAMNEPPQEAVATAHESIAVVAAPATREEPTRAVGMSVDSNRLALRLHGTGAIAQAGQVRELDIEVPVPGSWVGNQRVTLQLRLTLVPAPEDTPEDMNDGQVGPA